MSKVIEYLERFNRKERFFLLREALGDQTFRLDEGFINKLSCKIGFPVPPEAYVAMDYHLDWLQMALYLASESSPPGLIPNPNQDLVTGKQEDIDLLVAFEADEDTHLILIEAKGYTGWTNKQLCLKAKRLDRIFKDIPKSIRYHFVMMSPYRSQQIKTKKWPDWMKPDDKPLWLQLSLPKDQLKVTRCREDKASSKDGGYLRVDLVRKEHSAGES